MRNPGIAKASARRRSRTGKRQEVHVAARMGSVQLLTRTDRGLSSSNRGRWATDGRWSDLQWGAVEGMNGVVMVGDFCVVSRITASASALFHHGARLRFLAGSCADGRWQAYARKKPSDQMIRGLINLPNAKSISFYAITAASFNFTLSSFLTTRPDFAANAIPRVMEAMTLSPRRV